MTSYPEPLESGWGIQVVTPGLQHTFVLDEESLSALLLREDVRDRAVVVLSVAGAFRKGKSFLLSFLLRYLHKRYSLREVSGDWLGADDEPLKGFSWRGGSDRHTTGLMLWSQPFMTTLPTGEEVVILLMDTQGTFDSESTVRDCATVFALSTMLSSVQVYNLSQNIEEDSLQHLQLFTDYGRLVQKNNDEKPFQRLQFLVRDWSFPYEHPYGAEGGKQLLNKRLEIHEGQHQELQTLRQYITACFEELDCFLMPHPGLTVATNQEFNGKLKDISSEFKASLEELVLQLLAPERLMPKLIKGQTVLAKDLLHYFKVYLKVFNGSELPEPKTILEATAEANNLSAVASAKLVYEKLMDEVCGGKKSYVRPYVLKQEHRRVLDKALHHFQSRKKMGGQELAEIHRQHLLTELGEQYKQLKAHNEGKNILRLLGTPGVFGSLALLAYVAAALAGALGFHLIDSLGTAVAAVAACMLALWAYTRFTGNMRELAAWLDRTADVLRSYMLRYANDFLSSNPAVSNFRKNS